MRNTSPTCSAPERKRLVIDPVGLRLQHLSLTDQVVALARMASARSETGRFAPTALDRLFDDIGLPRPAKVSNILVALEKKGVVSRLKAQGSWRLTPKGAGLSQQLITDIDLAVLGAEMTAAGGTDLGHSHHPVIPPSLAPPELISPLATFLEAHPFETNIFGMTRFPDEQDADEPDPVATALAVASDVCAAHGLEFHLASYRAIVDDLWSNVTAHMWASKYGIAFFEDRRSRGLNYNLTIEVGGMLVMGRRCALLKDQSIPRLPTDLVGKIYRSVDLDKKATVANALHTWLRDDLALGPCSACP